jgi:hypothetical protein
MARPERFELPTNWFEASYSIQLSYGRVEARLYGLRSFLSSYNRTASENSIILRPLTNPEVTTSAGQSTLDTGHAGGATCA